MDTEKSWQNEPSEMAKSIKTKSNIKQMPGPDGAVALADPPAEMRNDPAAPETPFDEAPKAEAPAAPAAKTKNKGGRPTNADRDRLPPKTLTFFQRVQQIPAEDWGTRAKIRVYRLAPLIDRLRGSECKFICTYSEPLTEDKLKADQGSGRYRLYLGYKGAAEQGEKELDSTEIDILDPRFPPNINPGEWMDDPRNKQWAWAKPANTGGPNYTYGQPAPAPAPTAAPVDALIQGMKFATDVRKEVREEMQASSPAPAQQQPAAQAAAAVDPWAAAERILNMRSENPMVTVLEKQLTALQSSVEKDREERYKLQQQVFDAKLDAMKAQFQPAAATAPKGLVEQAKELATLLGVEPAEMMKRFLGVGDAAGPIKSKMSGTMEFIANLAEKIIESPLAGAIAQRLATPAPQQQPANGQHQPPQHQTQPNDPQAELFKFVNENITAPLIEHLRVGNTGTEFAEWVYNGFPLERLEALQNIQHQLMPGQKGAPVIIQLYKLAQGGQIWRQHLQQHENEFVRFVQDFCAWKPPEEEDGPEGKPEGPPTTGGPDDIIDLDAGNHA